MLFLRLVRVWIGLPALLALALAALGVGDAFAAPRIAGMTNMYYEPGHGTQVEYLAPNGQSYLWYPGNRVVLSAPWKVKQNEICFLYSSQSYNPVTRQMGGNWECMSVATWASAIVEQAKGDIFGLAKRTSVPFVLSKNRTTLAKLTSHDSAPASPAPPAKAPAETPLPSGRAPVELFWQVERLSCDYVLRHANDNWLSQRQAGGIFFWGRWFDKQGKKIKCGTIDYARAFELFRKSGDPDLFRDMTKHLKDLAAKGDKAAALALRTVDLTPLRK